MKRLLTLAAVLTILGLVVLAGCDSPAAQRERARAERVRAEAIAYQQQVQADTQAAAERANVRQMERDAAHQRALETLPYVVLIGGGVGVALVLVLMFWDLRRARPAAADPGLLFYLERLHLDQAERDRQLWRAIAHLDRRALAGVDDRREVTVYPDRWQ